MPEPSISATEICNRALVRVGANRIQDINNAQDGKAAIAATLYYETRDALLRRARWNFARKFVALAQLQPAPLALALAPDPDYQGQIIYTGAYQLPNDFIRLSNVSPQNSHWRIVGQTLYTDAAPQQSPATLIGLQPPNADGSDNVPLSGSTGATIPIGIEYIAKITDTTKYDSLFASCLAKTLAYEISFSINALESLKQLLRQEAQVAFDEARSITGMEQWPEQLFDTVVVDVRFGYNNNAGQGASLFS